MAEALRSPTAASEILPILDFSEAVTSPLLDRLARPLADLRISVTDRCNFRCTYCMPRAAFADHTFLARSELLTFEEIARLAGLFTRHFGVRKIRITGGEPLLRHQLPRLIAMLAELPVELTLTTNGALLDRFAADLKTAGLHRVTVSLDALNPAIFAQMADVRVPVTKVLAGIDAALAAGLTPLKVNMVVRRGVNEGEIIPMAERFRGSAVVVRFIEFMDVGTRNGWRMVEVVPAAEILARIAERWPIEPLSPTNYGEVAKRWRYCDGAGEIGVIASVTQPFCRSCTRLRLATDGKLYTCLFAESGYDLRALLRGGADDEAIVRAVAGIWAQRSDRYSEVRTAETASLRRRIEMSYIGG